MIVNRLIWPRNTMEACPWQNVGSDVTILIVTIASQLGSRWCVLIVYFNLATPWQNFWCGVGILIVVFLIVAVFVQSLCGNPVNNLVLTTSCQMLTPKNRALPSKHQQSKSLDSSFGITSSQCPNDLTASSRGIGPLSHVLRKIWWFANGQCWPPS